MLLSLAVALAAASGKLAFDSLVQRDAPDVNYGRSFARFEARFQLTWVLGAFLPVVLPLPERLGFFLVAIAAGFAAVTYYINTRNVPEGPAPALARGVEADATTVLAAGDERTADDERTVDPTERFEGAGPDPTRIDPAAGGPDDASRPVPGGSLPPPPPAPAAPPPARPNGWGDVPVSPTVTSVDGVEVDPLDGPHDVDAGATRQVAPRDE
jgi:hypothetical protein